jgi:CHAD domain-containing protein
MHATHGLAEAPSEFTAHETELEGFPAHLPPMPGDAQAWRNAHELALRRMDRMLTLEPKILRNQDPGSIHDFRVASRRAQQALDLLYPPPRPTPVRRIRKRIRQGRRAFSEIRNCDVLIESVEKRLARKRVGNREAWEAIQDYLRERRSSAREKALHRLARLRLSRVYLHVQGLRQDSFQPPQDEAEHSGAISAPLEGQFRLRLIQELERKWTRFAQSLSEGQPPHGTPPSLHPARIAGKKLRYLLEIVEEFHWPGTREIIEWLRTLQQLLGDWHDLDVAEQMMAEMLARPDFLRTRLDLASAVIRLIARNRRNKHLFQTQLGELGLNSKVGQWAQEWVRHTLAEGSHTE